MTVSAFLRRCRSLLPRALLVLGLVLGLGCAAREPHASGPPPTVRVDASADEPSSPDEILQARLREAVRGLDTAMGRRAPEQFGMVGVLHAAGSNRVVAGRIDPADVQRVVRAGFGRLRLCYDDGLRRNPNLHGRVSVEFVIDPEGKVAEAEARSDGLGDDRVVACVRRAFLALVFPRPTGVVRVTYPIVFSPDDASSPVPEPATPPSQPKPPPPSAPDPEGPWPIVVIEGTTVSVEGSPVGDLRAIVDRRRMQKVDGVFDAIEAHRERWRAAHPGVRYPGVAGLRAERDVPALVLKSVFQTIAFAGCPHIHLQAAEDPTVIVELTARVPGPPSSEPIAAVEPAVALHLRIDKGEVDATWKRGATVVANHRVARGTDDLGTRLCEWHRAHGVRREPIDPLQDPLVLHLDDGLVAHDIRAVARAAESCTRARRDGPNEPERREPVFWLTFSVR